MKQTDQAIKATENIAKDIEAALSAAVNDDYVALGAAMERIRTNNRMIQEILTEESRTARKG